MAPPDRSRSFCTARFSMRSPALPTINELPAPPPDREGWPWTEAPDALPESRSDGAPWPRISIVSPSYNQGAFLEETIRSVLLQGYPNLEYVVIDGDSDDDSVEIIEKYAPWLDFWESTPDRGQSHAINKGFERVDGDIYGWLNSDDVYRPRALRAVARGFEARPEAGALVGIGERVRLNGEVFYTPTPSELGFEAFLNWFDNDFLQPACLFCRSAWEAGGPLREDLYICLDVDLWLRMAKNGVKFAFLDEKIALAKAHGDAKTSVELERMRAETAWLTHEYGQSERSHEMIMELADDLAATRNELRRLRNDRAYRILAAIKNAAKSIIGRP